MKKNRFFLFVLIAVTTLLFLVSCGSKEAEEDEEITMESVIDEPKTASALAAYDGWWYIDDDSHDGVSMIDIFHLDAEAEKYTVYSNAGFAGATLNAKAGDDGELILDLELFGEASMILSDPDTLSLEDGMIFRRGDPMPEPSYSQFAGTWYEGGDESGNYYVFSVDGSYAYYLASQGESSETQEALESGTYTFGMITRLCSDGESFEYLELTLNDGSDFPADFRMLDNGAGLMDNGFGDKFFIRADALGSQDGIYAISFCRLVLTDTWTGDGGNYLTFSDDGTFALYSADGDGVLTPYDGGSWLLSGEDLFIFWNSGTQETVQFQTDANITITSLNETFTH